jgi:hemerythrin-like domain-containing protein
MSSTTLRVIREEHASLAAVLQSLRLLLDRGPADEPAAFFDVMRAMLFYIDEFPERQHHPKETELLFPRVAARSPEAAEAIAQLDREHAGGEAAVRELQHLLVGWELMGETRREAFAQALQRYIRFYMDHMRLEEDVVLPAALQHLGEADWATLDAEFAANANPLAKGPGRDPAYDRLFTRIVMRAPSPIGLG